MQSELNNRPIHSTDERIKEMLLRQGLMAAVRSKQMRKRRRLKAARRLLLCFAIIMGIVSPFLFYFANDHAGYLALMIVAISALLMIKLTIKLEN